MADPKQPEVPKLLQPKVEAPKGPSTLGKSLGTEMGRTPTRTVSPPKEKMQSPIEGNLLSNRELMAKSAQKISETKHEILKGEQAQKDILLKSDIEGAGIMKRGAETALAAGQKVVKDFPGPEWHPTPNNIQSLATICGLTALIGESMGGQGQMSAMNALSSMNGMMQGWQQGRSDLWQKEKAQHDAEWKRVKDIHEKAYKDMDIALKALPYERDEALTKGKLAAAELGSQVVRHYAELGQLENAHKILEGIHGDIKYVDEALMKQKDYHLRAQKMIGDMAHQERKDALAANKAGSGAMPKEGKTIEAFKSRKLAINLGDEVIKLLESDPKHADMLGLKTGALPDPMLAQMYGPEWTAFSSKLNQITTIMFELGGKALTQNEKVMLKPIYGYEWLNAPQLVARVNEMKSQFEKNNSASEAIYPGLKETGRAIDNAMAEYGARAVLDVHMGKEGGATEQGDMTEEDDHDKYVYDKHPETGKKLRKLKDEGQ